MLYTRFKIRAISDLLLVVFGFAQGVNARTVPQPGERETAIGLFREGEFGKALPLFSKLAYDFPYDFLLKYFSGACMVETGQYGLDAEKNLVLASGREVPSKVYYYLGVLYHARSNWNSAQRYYNRFRNNTDSLQVKELAVDELSNLCFRQINPFVSKETGEKADMVPVSPVIPEIPDTVAATPSTTEKSGAVVATPVTPEKELAEPATPVLREDSIPEKVTDEPILSGDSLGKLQAGEVDQPADSLIVSGSGSAASSALNAETLQGPLPGTTSAVVSATGNEQLPAMPETRRFINFRVNDKVTYVMEEMFQEPEALAEFKAAEEAEGRLDSLLTQTDALRKLYHQTLNPALRDSLARVIAAEEYQSLQQKAELERRYFNAASIEQTWWKDASYQVYETFFHIRDSMMILRTPPPPVIPEPGPDVFGHAADSLGVGEETPAGNPGDETMVTEEKGDELSYRIQLGAFMKNVPAQKKAMFDKISKIRIIETFVNEEGETVYTTGNLKDFGDAVKLQNQVRQEGIKDAFVIAVKNGKRVSLPK